MLLCRLGLTLCLMVMRLRRRSMHLCLVVLAQFVVMGRFPVVMRGCFVFRTRSLMTGACRVFRCSSH